MRQKGEKGKTFWCEERGCGPEEANPGRFLVLPFLGSEALQQLAQTNIQRHHHHKTQDGGPGRQFPVTTRREGKEEKEDFDALRDSVQAESILHNVQFQEKYANNNIDLGLTDTLLFIK